MAAGPLSAAAQTSIGVWYRAQEASGEHPRDKIEALLERQDWEAAAAACREWLDREASAAWPMGILAQMHERAGHLLTAHGLAARAERLRFDETSRPSPDLAALKQRAETALRERPALPILAPPFSGDVRFLGPANDPGAPIAATPAPAPAQAAPAKPAAASAVAAPKPPPAQRAAAAPAVPAKPAVPAEHKGEAKYLADPTGQWAISAVASSEYGKGRYDAMQATGAPDVTGHRDDPRAWCPSATSGRTEWIELSYARPVRVREVRVRQSHMPGTIVKIDGMTPEGATHVLWQGSDTRSYAAGEVGWLVIKAATAHRIARVKLTLDLNLKPGWKQIDAVQLVGD